MCTFKKVIYKCLKHLDCDFQEFLESKKERIKVQKYSYLLEKIFGLSKGSFSLYLNGPYNTKLADEVYEIARNEETYIENTNLKPLKQETVNILDEIKNIINSNPEIDDVDILELYTTYDYLKNNVSFIQENIFDKLREEKPYLFDKYSNIDIVKVLSDIDENINNILVTHGN